VTRGRGASARRNTLRALRRATATAAEIQGISRARQRHRLAREANAATALDTDLGSLYSQFGEDKRNVFAAGMIPDGTPFNGQTWRAR